MLNFFVKEASELREAKQQREIKNEININI